MLRSYLYVPADRPDRVAKASALDGGGRPDALIVDLEDAVALSAKADARASLVAWLAEAAGSGPQVFVRINSGSLGADDCTALAPAIAAGRVAGLVVPKATAGTVAALAGTVATRPAGSLSLVPIVESADGLHEIDAIATTPGVTALAIGEADLCADLGIRPGAEHALWPLRMRVVTASARARIEPPMGPVFIDVRDADGLARSMAAVRDAGFGSAAAIHPGQVATINAVFRPGAEEQQAAIEVLRAFEAAVREGRGVVVDANGRMIDEAVVRSARRILGKA